MFRVNEPCITPHQLW